MAVLAPCRRETKINRYDSLDDPKIDVDRLLEMMKTAFNGESPTKEYLERLKKVTRRVYLCSRYTGFILLTDEPGCDVPYMDKFVVSKLAQGIGTGKALWLEVLEDCNKLFWRSRRSNQINAWYHNVSHGHYRRHGEKDWVIFFADFIQEEILMKLTNCDIACNLESSWRSAEATNENNYTKQQVYLPHTFQIHLLPGTRSEGRQLRRGCGRLTKGVFFLLWKLYDSRVTRGKRICWRRTFAINSRPPFF